MRRRTMERDGLKSMKVTTVLDYTLAEESNDIRIDIPDEAKETLNNAKEVCFELSIKPPLEPAGKNGYLTFGIYYSGGYYSSTILNKADNCVPESSYVAEHCIHYFKNPASTLCNFVLKKIKNAQYTTKTEVAYVTAINVIDKNCIRLNSDIPIGVGSKILIVAIGELTL